jgi:hypothetical protein
LNRAATQRAQDITATSDQSREAADRLAIEPGEYDGMVVRLGVTFNVHNSKDLNADTAR